MAFILKPLVTEKMTKITDMSSADRSYTAKADKKGRDGEIRIHKGDKIEKPIQVKYGFIVDPRATKLDIKKEVESLYDVKVIGVNTCKYAGKRQERYTRKGLVKGKRPAYKKAIVTLQAGDSIDFYSNI